jgi:hypothetical protein
MFEWTTRKVSVTTPQHSTIPRDTLIKSNALKCTSQKQACSQDIYDNVGPALNETCLHRKFFTVPRIWGSEYPDFKYLFETERSAKGKTNSVI